MKSNCTSYSSCSQRVSRAKRLVSDSCSATLFDTVSRRSR